MAADAHREWSVGILRTVMRAAIPPEDVGSRQAIQYAPEIFEFMEDFGVILTKDSRYSPQSIVNAIEEMDRLDGKERHQ